MRHPLGAVAFLIGFQLALLVRAAAEHERQLQQWRERCRRMTDDADTALDLADRLQRQLDELAGTRPAPA